MDNPWRELPALDALKGFESAARHLSFTRAADELCLSQSAVSRQIQGLEERLGVTLFRRMQRRLVLTPEGELLYRAAAEALGRLADACAGLRSAQRRPRVTVSAAISVASLWLVPRLAVFQAREPGLDVLISADNRVVDLEREDIDLALRYASPEAVPAGAIQLFGETVFPVASPAVAASLPNGLDAAALAQATLLAFAGTGAPWLAWEPWLAGLGLTAAQPKAVLHFTQYDQLIRAAEDGSGVALGRGPLVAQALAEGRLQAVGTTRQTVAGRAYYLLRAPQAERSEVTRFADWLVAEARGTGG